EHDRGGLAATTALDALARPGRTTAESEEQREKREQDEEQNDRQQRHGADLTRSRGRLARSTAEPPVAPCGAASRRSSTPTRGEALDRGRDAAEVGQRAV